MRVNKRISRRFRWKVNPSMTEINYEKGPFPVLLFDLREKKVHKCFKIRDALSIIIRSIVNSLIQNMTLIPLIIKKIF